VLTPDVELHHRDLSAAQQLGQTLTEKHFLLHILLQSEIFPDIVRVDF
jgi:hypothetical protein